MLDLFQTGDAAPVPRVAPGLRAGDVLVAINGSPVEDREQAIAQLLAAATAAPPPAVAGDAGKQDNGADDEAEDENRKARLRQLRPSC